MQQIESLTPGNYYHIYNQGVQGCVLFRDRFDYERFLTEYERYIDVVAETYAWCLMGNHFHLLIRVLEEEEISPFQNLTMKHQLKSAIHSYTNPSHPLQPPQPPSDPSGADGVYRSHKPKPSTQFSHFFNSYAQYYNKKYHRRGVLFQRPFKRKLVDDPEYLRRLVIYTLWNPVHHGFVRHLAEYPWSNYTDFTSVTPAKVYRKKVAGWFDADANFVKFNHSQQEVKRLEDWLEL